MREENTKLKQDLDSSLKEIEKLEKQLENVSTAMEDTKKLNIVKKILKQKEEDIQKIESENTQLRSDIETIIREMEMKENFLVEHVCMGLLELDSLKDMLDDEWADVDRVEELIDLIKEQEFFR